MGHLDPASRAGADDEARALVVEHLTVTYGSNRAIDDVSVTFRLGEVHALLGPNGSGKSTLVKALSGVVAPRAGATLKRGTASLGGSMTPERAIAAGLRFVHQDLALVPELTAIENLYLTNAYPTRLGTIDWTKARRRAGEVLDAVRLTDAADLPVQRLSPSHRVLLATARALMGLPDAGGYVFVDEPTASLDDAEAADLLTRLRDLVGRGTVGIVLITHRLREVLQFADRATVLRDGRVTLEAPHAELDHNRLLAAIAGGAPTATTRDRSADSPPSAATGGAQPALEIRDLSGGVLRELSLTVAPGEIVGVTGLEGSGKDELITLIYGMTRPRSGTMHVSGQPFAPRNPRDAMHAGVGLVPNDRRTLGGISELTVADNLLLPRVGEFAPRGWYRRREADTEARECITEFDVRPSEPARVFGTLSGGNQQKVVVGRWLRKPRAVLLLHEPTAGVDVASRAALYEHIRDATREGVAVLVASADHVELVELCDRVAVLADGRLRHTLSRGEVTMERLVQESFA